MRPYNLANLSALLLASQLPVNAGQAMIPRITPDAPRPGVAPSPTHLTRVVPASECPPEMPAHSDMPQPRPVALVEDELARRRRISRMVTPCQDSGSVLPPEVL